ncbi:hypothetical protein PMPD1_1527 [Paramixta manurensis]|uniref:DUF3592 domain-containing protein n=1 Tax=Paramixta manurensis TaxID=2740817 RepID=A0A6M8UI37_9GAMM|nr:hypothetical protein PMPD1_1527 [Erwiniaceae bacterium PD-1]
MKEAFIIVIIVAFLFYIGKQFYRDRVLTRHGITTMASIIESKQVSGNETGSINGFFTVSFKNQKNQEEIVSFQTTIPQLYASQVQKGKQIKVIYLEADHRKIDFIFD